MNVLDILQKGLEAECRKLHKGEAVQISMSPQVDANTVQVIRTTVESLYRSMFHEDLQIEAMERDEYGVLRISVVKKP